MKLISQQHKGQTIGSSKGEVTFNAHGHAEVEEELARHLTAIDKNIDCPELDAEAQAAIDGDVSPSDGEGEGEASGDEEVSSDDPESHDPEDTPDLNDTPAASPKAKAKKAKAKKAKK